MNRDIFNIIVLILFATAIIFFIPYLVMLLWNGMLPDMFEFPEIGYWRAWGLSILGNLLFGGILKYNQSK
jgi:hypothetical protein